MLNQGTAKTYYLTISLIFILSLLPISDVETFVEALLQMDGYSETDHHLTTTKTEACCDECEKHMHEPEDQRPPCPCENN